MTQPIFNYDAISDTLSVSFAPGEKATGIELTEQMLLRVNKGERRAIGLTFLDYSILAQQTAIGPLRFPLTGFAQLSDELQEMVLEILKRPPVNELLLLSSYTPSLSETMPIAMLRAENAVFATF